MKINLTRALLIAILLLNLFSNVSKAQTKKSLAENNTIHSKTVLFITGAFVTNQCWDDWKTYFEGKGYKTLAPAWPYKDGTAKELRARQPNDTLLAGLTLDSVINYYAAIAKACPEKPILIGHSLGGLIVQVLVNRGLGDAGVAIHPVPTKGVIPYERSSVRSITSSLGLFTSSQKTYMMSFSRWQYAFTNGMPLDQQKSTYNDFTIPESKMVARGGLSKAAKVNYQIMHAPLLITSGTDDNILPAHLNKRNFNRYQDNGSIITYKEFAGRNHFVLGQLTWKEDADYILSWISKYSAPAKAIANNISN